MPQGAVRRGEVGRGFRSEGARSPVVPSHRYRGAMALASLLSALLLASPWAVPSQEGYRLPPKPLVDLLDAPPTPGVDFAPDGRHLLLLEREAMPSIADVSRRMLRVAGVRIDPVANARYRTSFLRGLAVRATRASGASDATSVPLPAGEKLVEVAWSHDGERFWFVTSGPSGSKLFAGHLSRPAEPVLVSERLNTVLVSPRFMPDGRSLLFAELPVSRGPEPEAPEVPTGPNMQSTSGSTSPLRTYQDLLASPHDEALFEHYATTVLVVASTDGGGRRVLGDAALHASVRPSPDGTHFLVTRILRPWSWVMPYWSFPQSIEVWGGFGNKEHVLARLPLAENVPIGGVRTGPRSVGWKPGEPATLVWVEALDGGDPDREVEHRDRWLSLAAPFEGEPHELVRVEERAQGLSWFPDGGRVVTREYDRDRRWIRSLLVDFSTPDAAPRVLEDRSIRDRYGDPGSILREPDAHGSSVVRVDGPWIYRAGSGASPEGSLPFLDRQSLETLETERLWRCSPGSYETVALVLPGEEPDGPSFVTRHETPVEPPNYRLHASDAGPRVLTSFPDPTPGIRGIRKELVTYERADGVPLSATLYTPAGHEPGERLPLLVWAYPIEFNDARTAGQVSASPWRFTRIAGSSHLALVTQGYAVMDGATMPVIGDPETMNDTFVEQITAAAEAAIAKAAEMGVADPERVAVGGHSYGAFMTANLLAHCDLFKAGIARSGAYNRTLTPFGFQSERRPIWEALETYVNVSPFFHADQLKEPLLLIHGEVDNNSGTYPMQSERLFQAIKGNGGTARLVMLPNESHGYRARESVLHVQAEMLEWLDEHVKGEGP